MTASTARRSSSVSVQPAAAAFACACSGFVAPAITLVTAGRREEPRDRELEERVAAIARERVERLDPVEHLVGERVVHPFGGHAGQARAGRRLLVALVLAGQDAARQREVRDETHAVALARVEHTEALRSAPQQAVLVLHADEASEAAVGADARRCRRSARPRSCWRRSRAPCPRAPTRRAPRGSRRTGSTHPGSATGTGRCGRCPNGGGCPPRRAAMYAALAPPLRSSSIGPPNLVATTASSRREPSARPRYSSLSVPP